MIAQIHTARLVLRLVEERDAERVSRYSSDWDVAKMTGAMPYPNPPIAAQGRILIAQARALAGGEGMYAIDLPGEGLIGVCGAHPLEGGVTEIGYWIGKPWWGHGYATEAARAVAEAWAPRSPGGIVAAHNVDNPASGRVLEKAGFVPTGAFEERFSLARRARASCRVLRFETRAQAAPRSALA